MRGLGTRSSFLLKSPKASNTLKIAEIGQQPVNHNISISTTNKMDLQCASDLLDIQSSHCQIQEGGGR